MERSYNTESGRERGAIKRQTKGKKKEKRRKEKGRKNKIYFSHLSQERATRAYGVLSETFIFLLVGRARVHEHNKEEREGRGFGRHW